ncbi:hypothetical protein CONCODRAFT_8784 [Conidiobolus coronatus NRRL 28638]|uniref:F-box domain-containing protein n=1 Tax=Conidiobolus coronatus (strain ATCC 28846 / CBS 209.66 / NRRL 28638) TaxID=796925 RepID=A0A137P1C9_CONC2|nr:hypothetical protein CONCODRAFT_8784 [Conidiobolus coronatus NRRL 28638]|eukprot:KXN68876.1 hypothetical protein CONCODRAFT_8784 [Conidiobolus coronatus NRRL 28638]
MTASEVNWAKLPKKIIKKIGSNIDNAFLLNARLVNKHWLDSLNELVFSSLENWSSDSIPELVKNHSTCIKSWSSSFRNEEYTQLVTDNVKSLESISWDNGEEFLGPLNKLIANNPNIKSLSIEIGDYRDQDEEFADFINLVKSLKHLDTLKFQTFVPPLLPLVDAIKNMNLKNLSLKGLTNEPQAIWEAYNNSPNLKSFSLELISDVDIEARPIRETVISPNSFEFHPTLEHVNLLASSIMHRKYTYEYYGKELLLAFENPKFRNLKSFTWKLDGMVFTDDVISIYKTPVTITSKQCPNLTFLSLELCDSHLLSLISKQFPNLAQLNLNCPLPLPHPQNNHDSLVHLTKLAISGYYHEAVRSPSTTQAIFPSVSVLKLQDSRIESNDFNTELSKISTLFPSVKHLISYDDHEKWYTLLDTNESYNWEELYIEAKGEDAKKAMKLISKLPNLKVLYLYNYENNLKENGFTYNGDACVIRASGIDDGDYVTELFQKLNC